MQKATRQQTRSHNRRLILRTIYARGEISRAEIARVTHLTRTTVSHIVAELINEELVEETGRGPSEGGKPPVLLHMNPQARVLIGVDLANSEFRAAVIDMRGRFLQRVQSPVHNSNGDEALDLVYSLLETLIAKTESPILGIAVGTPGLVDAQNGIVRQAVNLDWRNLALRQLLRERFDLPVYIGNDSHLAALGQFTFGEDRTLRNLVVVNAGRGIGAGIVLDGRLLYGDSSGAGEIGHTRVVENGALCLCGHNGCLETVASTRALVGQARAFAAANPQAAVNALVAAPQEITTEVLIAAVRSGDGDICRLVAKAGEYLGIAISHLVGALNIERIIISGSLARFGPPLLNAIDATVRPRAMRELAAHTRIEMSDLGQDIVMLGAASLILSSELGVA